MATSSDNILFIVGDDDYLVEREARNSINAHVPPDFRESAIEVVDGNATNAETQLASIRTCLGSLQTPPFLDPMKLTWWKDVMFFPGGGKNGRISEDVKVALERFADSLGKTPLPPNQFLVITAAKLLSTSVFAKRMKSLAKMVEHKVPERSRDRAAAALANLPALAKAENLSFAPGADRAFVAKTGSDTRTIVSELAKMRAYLGEEVHAVTVDDVAAITSTGGDETEIWELTDALASRNVGRVLSVLRNFQGSSGWPIMVSTVVERWFRDLILAKAGAVQESWKARKNAASAAGFTFRELLRGRERMLALRERLVSAQPTDEYVELELLRTIKR